MSSKKIVLNGESLKAEEIRRLVFDASTKIKISDKARDRVKKSKNFLESSLNTPQIIYGVNTGFGPMASHIVSKKQSDALQKNLIYSHAVGMGEPIPPSFALAGMIVRLNTLVKGYSGVSEKLVRRLQFFINERIIPLIPEHGAVGTSGDLVQLAHIALGLMGKGEVFFGGKYQSAVKVLQKFKISPFQFTSREGLAIINGTAVMTGIAALLHGEAKKIIDLAVETGAIALELVKGFDDSLEAKLHRLRPHSGQVAVAHALRQLLRSSHRLRDRRTLKVSDFKEDVKIIADDVQQVYSLRCIAQILGPILDVWQRVEQTIGIELNAVTDNPVIDWERKKFIHGGNFHGEYIAVAMDHLKMALVKLSILSERRINFFLHPQLNRIFPPFMNLKKPGLTLGLQGLQFVATSTVAQNQSLAFPHHIHSISTNGDNQDVVSMGTDAALLLNKVIENTYIVLAIELIVLAQGWDFVGSKGEFSKSTQKLLKNLRKILPAILEDRVLVAELPKVVAMLKQDNDFNALT